jgi:hypothetical protein
MVFGLIHYTKSNTYQCYKSKTTCKYIVIPEKQLAAGGPGQVVHVVQVEAQHLTRIRQDYEINTDQTCN